MQDIIKDKVSIRMMIYSDAWKLYNSMGKDLADNQTMNHSEAEYMNGIGSYVVFKEVAGCH